MNNVINYICLEEPTCDGKLNWIWLFIQNWRIHFFRGLWNVGTYIPTQSPLQRRLATTTYMRWCIIVFLFLFFVGHISVAKYSSRSSSFQEKKILFIMAYLYFRRYPAKWKDAVGATTKSIIIISMNEKSSNNVGGTRPCQKMIILCCVVYSQYTCTIMTIYPDYTK